MFHCSISAYTLFRDNSLLLYVSQLLLCAFLAMHSAADLTIVLANCLSLTAIRELLLFP